MFKGLKSLIAGIAAGTALGIFFSPKKGEEIRKNVKAELNEGGTGLKTLKDTFSKWGKDLSETAKDYYEEVSESEEFQAGKAKATKTAKKVAKKAVELATNKTTKKIVRKAAKKVSKVTKQAAKKVGEVKEQAAKAVKAVKKVVKKKK